MVKRSIPSWWPTTVPAVVTSSPSVGRDPRRADTNSAWLPEGHEADFLRVWFVRHAKALVVGDFPDLRFAIIAHGKQHPRQEVSLHAKKHVRLIFVMVDAAAITEGRHLRRRQLRSVHNGP